jgi:hypothetical protein
LIRWNLQQQQQQQQQGSGGGQEQVGNISDAPDARWQLARPLQPET